MESNRKRGGFMKGKLMPFYRAAKPNSKTSVQYSSIAIATSKVKPSQATTSPAYSVGYTVHGQDYVIAAAQPKQKVSFIVPAGADHHTKNSLIQQPYFDHYGGAGDEGVDMKAASYISSVQERFKLERINS